jgi:uncharacterized protein (UPF0335 family)
MTGIALSANEQQFFLTIDKNVISREKLQQFLDRIRLEYLVEKADFDDSIEQLGEEIKADWWAKNKARLLGEPL